MTKAQKSDLIDLVHHENHHMTKLFGDLRVTFDRLVIEELDAAEGREIAQTASEDLNTAFEELLHHFSLEEEVFFIEMERRFPELSEEIANLVATHEFICERTRWLENVLIQGVEAVVENLDRLRETLSTLETRLVAHTETENEIFGKALPMMTPAERESLLTKMREIG